MIMRRLLSIVVLVLLALPIVAQKPHIDRDTQGQLPWTRLSGVPSGKRGFGATFGTCAGTAPTAGMVAYVPVLPFACTITGYAISADAGTATFKVWRAANGTAIPTVAGVINTSGLSLSSGTRLYSSTVSDFTDTTLDAGDVLAITLTAVATATCVQTFVECTNPAP